MVHVIPAVLEKTIEGIREKVERIRPYTDIIQLDVMDGAFVPNETFRNPAQLRDLPITMEVHLMIERPVLFLNSWALPNVKRLIVHFEAVDNMEHMIQHMRQTGKEVGIAMNPGTSTYELKPYINDIDLVLIMGVDPGFSGQGFQKDVLEKIKEIKKFRPDVLVEVDGGVNADNRDAIVKAGADILAAASFVWKAPDLGVAMAALKGE
jgi:ribulose-phosphate 3-epimerase